MVFVACGLNHKTAPIEVREKIALPQIMQDDLLQHLISLPAVNEAAILSTCNRTEIYCDTDAPSEIVPWLVHKHAPLLDNLLPYFYSYQGNAAIRHTLRVASGLDSMMLGEPQILGQLKQAYQQACLIGAAHTRLRPTFDYIFSASKRVRRQSGIGANPVSIAYAAVQLVGQLFKSYEPLSVLLIGAGETSTLVAKHLHKQGVRSFTIASRTRENAEQLAAQFNGQALAITDIPLYLAQSDIVISATSCPLPFINKNVVDHAQQLRNYRPLFLLDLSVPRDIEADVAQLENVHLYNIDALQTMVTNGMNQRRTAALQAEQLIDVELDNYVRWHRSLLAKNVICDYRTQMQSLAKVELERAQARLSSGFNNEIVLNELCDRLVKKLVHNPTVGLTKAAYDGREELLDLTHYLFKLPDEPIPL